MSQFNEIKLHIELKGFTVVTYDFDRPWGGFLVIDEAQAQEFANYFFFGPRRRFPSNWWKTKP